MAVRDAAAKQIRVVWTWHRERMKSVWNWLRARRLPTAQRLSDGMAVIVQMLEVAILIGVAVWVAAGAVKYGTGDGWTFKGLLTMLDEKWRGALILVGLFFYRSVQETLARTKSFKLPWGEAGEPLAPSSEPKQQSTPAAPTQQPAPPGTT
jgi:hypothetical protein